MEKATVYATQKYAKTSTKKAGIVLDLIRGKDALEAERILKFDHTKAAKLTLKVLQSAIANAKNNKDLSVDNLVVSDLRADAGPMRKTGRPTGRGRFNRILKRTSHLVVGLSEKKKTKENK